MLTPTETLVDRQPEHFDVAAIVQCCIHRDRLDENSTRNVDTNAGFVGRSRVPVEVLGELVANPGQFVDDEVRDRGGSVGLSLLGEERVEAVEELLSEPDGSIRHGPDVARRASSLLP